MKQHHKNIQEGMKDVYQRITDEVLVHLEKGEVIWRKGWSSFGMPKNIATGRMYQGWNMFLLNFITMTKSYKTPFFMTYKQAMDMGGTIRKGQKGYPVVWWAAIESKKNKDCDESEQEEGHAENTVQYRVPKLHTVFNIDQTQGIEFPKVEACMHSHSSKINACEEVVSNMPQRPDIRFGGDRAFYHPTEDFIKLPEVERFYSDENYYAVLFHELAHSTGHASRLNRKELVETDGFGGENYSKEELTAELTASFLCGICGIGQATIENSAAYIRSWLDELKKDKRFILKAATQAQAAADFILGAKQAVTPAALHQATLAA